METISSVFGTTMDAIIFGLVFLLILFAGVGFTAYMKSSKKKIEQRRTSSSSEKEEHWAIHWAKDNAVQLTLMWVFLLFLPLAFDERGEGGIRDWWWNTLTTKMGLVILFGFLLFGVMQYHDLKKPFRFKLAKIGIWLLGVLFLWLLFIGPKTPLNFWSKWNFPTGIVVKANSTFMGRTTFQAEANQFWYDNIPRREAWDMMDIFRLETTNFRHFNHDGSVVTNLNTDGTLDVGLGQLNLTYSAEEIAACNCDVTTVEGNLKAALLVYRNGGAKRWTGTYKKMLDLPITKRTFEAPVGVWSENFPLEKGSNCYWEVDRVIQMKDDQGREYTFTPERIPPFMTTYVAYKVVDEPPGVVTVQCR